MEKDLLETLRGNISTYSKGKRAIAMYLLGAPVQAALMTAKQLGDAVGVSEATVVRFATELGYSGYPQMQRDMRSQWISNAQEPAIPSEEDFSEAFLASDARGIQSTMLSLRRGALQTAIDGVVQAKRIFVFGLGMAAPVAAMVGDVLHTSFRDVHKLVSPDEKTIRRDLMHISNEDVVITLCADNVQGTTELLEYCNRFGAFRVAICDEKAIAIQKYCNVCLPVQSGKSLASMVSFGHMMAEMLLVRQKGIG